MIQEHQSSRAGEDEAPAQETERELILHLVFVLFRPWKDWMPHLTLLRANLYSFHLLIQKLPSSGNNAAPPPQQTQLEIKSHKLFGEPLASQVDT